MAIWRFGRGKVGVTRWRGTTPGLSRRDGGRRRPRARGGVGSRNSV